MKLTQMKPNISDERSEKKSEKQAVKQKLRNERVLATKKFYTRVISFSVLLFAIVCGLWLEKSHVTQLKCLHPDLEKFFNADCCMDWKFRLSMRSDEKLMAEVEKELVGQSLVKFVLRGFYGDLRLGGKKKRLPIQVFYGPSGTGKQFLSDILKVQLIGKKEASRNLVEVDLGSTDRGFEVTEIFSGITDKITCPYRILTINNGQKLTLDHVKHIKTYPNSTVIVLYEENADSMQNLLKTASASLFVDRSEDNIKNQLNALTRYIRGRLYENESSPFYRDPSEIFETIRIFPFLPLAKPDLLKILHRNGVEFRDDFLDTRDKSFAKFNVLNEIEMVNPKS